MNQSQIKKLISDIFLINACIAHLIFSFISNYDAYSFILKFTSSSVVSIMILRRIEVSFVKSSIGRFKLFILFILYIFGSIFWSANEIFGLLKLMNLIVSVIPIFLCTLFFLQGQDDRYIKLFTASFIVLGLVFSVTAIILRPFNFSSVYLFEPGRWSHVVFGRIIGIAFILSALRLISNNNYRILTAGIMLVFLFTVYYCGARAAFSGIVIVSFILLVYSLPSRRSKGYILLIFFTLFAVSIFFFTLLYLSDISQRYTNIYYFFSRDRMDSSLSSRLSAWVYAVNLFLSHPIFGAGLGGFNNPGLSELSAFLKYPHNIFLEVISETGIAGLILFGLIFSKIIRNIKNDIRLTVFFVFFLWLALFSKDLASNSVIFVFLELNKVTEKQSDRVTRNPASFKDLTAPGPAE